MTEFESFYPLILPWAPGASAPAMDNALRQAAIEFCEKTNVWQELSDQSTVLANINGYDVQEPEEGVLVKILNMTFNGSPVTVKTPDELEMKYSSWTTETGTPQYFTQIQPDQFILVPKPSEKVAKAIAYRAAYRPSETASGLPDVLYKHHARAIADGALSALLAEKNVPYSDPQEAITRLTLFQNKITDTSLKVQKAFGRGAVRTKARYF